MRITHEKILNNYKDFINNQYLKQYDSTIVKNGKASLKNKCDVLIISNFFKIA